MNPIQQALQFYADPSDYKAPLTGGMGKLWHDCGETAREALRSLNKEVEGVELPEPFYTEKSSFGWPSLWDEAGVRTAIAAALGRERVNSEAWKNAAQNAQELARSFAPEATQPTQAECPGHSDGRHIEDWGGHCMGEGCEYKFPQATQPTHLATSDPEGHRQAIADHEAEAPCIACGGANGHESWCARKRWGIGQPTQAEATSEREAFEDSRVQAVYDLLCDETPPPKGEHWEGFAARRIVASLATQQAEPNYTHADVSRAHAEGYKLGLMQVDRPTQQAVQAEPVATLTLGARYTRDGVHLEWHKDLPEGVHDLYTAP